MALPKRRTRWKSEDFFRRNLLFTNHNSIQDGSGVQAALLARSAVPVGLLDVVIHPHAERFAAFCAASLEHVAASAGGHAGPESVDTDAASFFRLVCSLRHFFTSILT